MTTPDIRVCFLGDSFTLGTGDPDGLGWVGRVLAAERGRGADLTAYNLGVRGQTGAQIAERAAAEVTARLQDRGDRQGVVISFGANDLYLGRPPSESVQAMRGLLQWAKGEGYAAFVVAAPPMAEAALQSKQDALNTALAQVCADFAVPMLNLPAVVEDWSAWRGEAEAGDGVHPGAEGYRRVAMAFEAWPAWREWLQRD
ncbi:MAG TPA: GDSL-type esterase/lipase family protein [Caulobacteraceae bacterium]|nr:GDSL-type esterase/lipase family protein [Caulobacteraceae bacterium]